MKKFVLIMCCIMVSNTIMSQHNIVFKQNNALKSLKTDSQNIRDLDNLSTYDILDALEMMGIEIFKAKIPRTDKEYSLSIVVDEYSKRELIKSENIWNGKNIYNYWERGDTVIYKDFIEELTLFTKQNKADSTVSLRVKTYSGSSRRQIKYKPERKESFYNIRRFRAGEFRYGEKIPIIAIASSWYDEKFKINRFCGVAVLSLNEKSTEELLNQSPNYYIVSYIIK